jgi:hypothetical protein
MFDKHAVLSMLALVIRPFMFLPEMCRDYGIKQRSKQLLFRSGQFSPYLLSQYAAVVVSVAMPPLLARSAAGLRRHIAPFVLLYKAIARWPWFWASGRSHFPRGFLSASGLTSACLRTTQPKSEQDITAMIILAIHYAINRKISPYAV